MILLDTNLLTRMTRSHDPQSGIARAAIQTLRGRGERLIVVPDTFRSQRGSGSPRGERTVAGAF
jgi:hypothetical protein